MIARPTERLRTGSALSAAKPTRRPRLRSAVWAAERRTGEGPPATLGALLLGTKPRLDTLDDLLHGGSRPAPFLIQAADLSQRRSGPIFRLIFLVLQELDDPFESTVHLLHQPTDSCEQLEEVRCNSCSAAPHMTRWLLATRVTTGWPESPGPILPPRPTWRPRPPARHSPGVWGRSPHTSEALSLASPGKLAVKDSNLRPWD